ncbi:MAG: glycosyltransferase family 2 protein [Cyanobacteria bacterium J06614_10]
MTQSAAPLLTIIIPTYQRPALLQRAVCSALEQQIEGKSEAAIEVLVVDDGSPQPVVVDEHPRLRLVRLPVNRGGAAARNEGARLAKGKYISYLDDDDRLLPGMAEMAIAALEKAAHQEANLPQPVAVLGGIEVVNAEGRVASTRWPPTLPKGAHFALETAQPGKSFLCKQTLVVERAVLLSIGGFDEFFQSRVHTELFLRLNQVCSILGLPVVTYQLTAHEGPRVSRNPALRQLSFEQLIAKHRDIFEAHPPQFAQFVYRHAQVLLRMGQKRAAFQALLWALKIHPLRGLRLLSQEVKSGFKRGAFSLSLLSVHSL